MSAMKTAPLNTLALAIVAAIVAACGSHPARPESDTVAATRGVYVSDLDRSADPCTDFFGFSNGTWRQQNPIPASMTRWSRRWQAGETSKDRLKDILAKGQPAFKSRIGAEAIFN